MSQPNEKDLARFQAQLVLALLKRQLHDSDHLSAEQLAQLIAHTAPPESAAQWKQHLIDCQDCYAVFLDVAQLQLEQQPVSAMATKKSWWLQWRYAMVAVLPMALVAMLYFGLPQQTVELQRNVVEGTPAVQFDHKKRTETESEAASEMTQAKPKSAPVLREEKIAEAMSVPAVNAPAPAEMPATPEATATPAVVDSAVFNQAGQAPQRFNNPLITAQANERAQQTEADELHKRELSARTSETIVASAAVAKAEPPPPAAGAAETIEVVGARVSAIDADCDDTCSPDERFEQALQKWIDTTQTQCREQKLNVLQTRQQWRELLGRHQVAKRDELAKLEEPNKAEGWCEFSLKLQQRQ